MLTGITINQFLLHFLWECASREMMSNFRSIKRLHHRAGSSPLELHGTVYTVICLDCGHSFSRHIFQDSLKELNPNVSFESRNFLFFMNISLHRKLIRPFTVGGCYWKSRHWRQSRIWQELWDEAKTRWWYWNRWEILGGRFSHSNLWEMQWSAKTWCKLV